MSGLLYLAGAIVFGTLSYRFARREAWAAPRWVIAVLTVTFGLLWGLLVPVAIVVWAWERLRG